MATRIGAWALQNFQTHPFPYRQGGGVQVLGGPVAQGQSLIRSHCRHQDGLGHIVPGNRPGPGLLLDGGWVEEHEVDHGRHLTENRHPLLDQRGQPTEHVGIEGAIRPRRRLAGQPRFAGVDERVHRHGPDVLAVDMGELDHVEERRRMVDVFEVEPFHQLVDVEDLLAAGRAASRIVWSCWCLGDGYRRWSCRRCQRSG